VSRIEAAVVQRTTAPRPLACKSAGHNKLNTDRLKNDRQISDAVGFQSLPAPRDFFAATYESVLNSCSREVWRKTGRERDFGFSAGASQCGGFRAEPVYIRLLFALARRQRKLKANRLSEGVRLGSSGLLRWSVQKSTWECDWDPTPIVKIQWGPLLQNLASLSMFSSPGLSAPARKDTRIRIGQSSSAICLTARRAVKSASWCGLAFLAAGKSLQSADSPPIPSCRDRKPVARCGSTALRRWRRPVP
jgi:hypothetical protein